MPTMTTDDARNDRHGEAGGPAGRTGAVMWSADQTRVTLGGGVISLTGDELDLILEALAALDDRDGAAVAEQIAALRIAGGTIDLMPTEAEGEALRLAAEGLAGARRGSGGMADLAAICADGGSALRIGIA
jgi:hypothetical protein